ncbi:DUF5103 domain-containing protein [Pontibacter harenae]|uniref:type IX secretion system plug protein n=1 Tax=Pontibacter harenae TaxID=2894083 RepID=UPI001E28CB9D|nr:DUF5103 domain-containing protein [Pontibacter harenae]MCC9168114.1 DUF5103 domain-containing protein [Pontibacter harenae]
MVACVPIEQQGQSSTGNAAQTSIRYEDFIYDASIKSVQCYRATGGEEEVLEPAVVKLNEGSMMLEFDRLDAGPQRLLAKLVHCNADWTPSGLAESQYLNDFNEFFLTDVQTSINTRVPYVHYQFRVPRVKLSGNYVLVVQEEGGSLLITRRLLVYQELVSVTTKLGAPTGSPGQQERQPVEFNVFYNNYELVNPVQEVKAIMRQNHRWDNAKRYARPAFVREDVKRLEYVFFEPKDHFMGLSEFRAFDTRSVRYNGIGVAGVNLNENPIAVDLQTDISRQGQAYSQDPDINGKRLFNIREYTQGDVSADYTWVDFELETPQVGSGAVYVLGELTNWRLSNESRLQYDEARGIYTGKLLLKQGYYNYYYGLQPSSNPEADAAYFEGSHFSTNNVYDILIYYRPPGTRADLLIGYTEILYNRF